MPLTIAGSDLQKGTITLVVQEVGLSPTRLCELNEGESITDVAVSYTHLKPNITHTALAKSYLSYS